jgi:hypothetical protein
MPKRPGPLSARRLAELRREAAEYGWWADDLTGWAADYPLRLAPPAARPYLQRARTEFLMAVRSLIDVWIERSDRAVPARIPRASRKRTSRPRTGAPAVSGARRGARSIRVR